jgi:hypothetical protein
MLNYSCYIICSSKKYRNLTLPPQVMINVTPFCPGCNIILALKRAALPGQTGSVFTCLTVESSVALKI